MQICFPQQLAADSAVLLLSPLKEKKKKKKERGEKEDGIVLEEKISCFVKKRQRQKRKRRERERKRERVQPCLASKSKFINFTFVKGLTGFFIYFYSSKVSFVLFLSSPFFCFNAKHLCENHLSIWLLLLLLLLVGEKEKMISCLLFWLSRIEQLEQCQ